MEKLQKKIPFIGEKAPKFSANSTIGKINFPDDFSDKYIIFFSHPADFTPICSSEFMTFAKHYDEFIALKSVLVGISADSLYSHIACLRTITEKLEFNGIKNISIKFPLITDSEKKIINQYGMVHADNDFPSRALFIIDPNGIIRASMFYPLYNGRNIKEIKRLLIAIQRHDEQNVATPANWHPGDDVISRNPRTIQEANERMEKISKLSNENKKCFDWFSCFQSDQID